MKKFPMTLPDEFADLVDQIRADDPIKPSRRQQYTKIVKEWLEWKGYLKGSKRTEIELLKARIAQLENQ